jgi:predicted nucleic acid-binding protein
MRYLLDTCVVSELIKKQPEKWVIDWLQLQTEGDLFLSVLTIGEIGKGIAKMPDSLKKEQLHHWLDNDLRHRFHNRILPIHDAIALLWGAIQGNAEKNGQKLAVIDSLIAATAIFHDLTLVTRNSADMMHSGCQLLNPWEKSS